MILYQIRRNTRSKGLRMSVSPQGSVIVSAPPFYPKLLIDRFVSKNERWVTRQLYKIKLKKENEPLILWKQQLVSYKGRLYQFEFNANQDEKIVLRNKRISIHPPTGMEIDLKKTLLSWLKLESQLYIHKRVMELSQAMSVTYTSVKFRQQRSRWGSCTAKGGLSFNWRLIHFSEDIIDYVIIHELAHRRHMNHSKVFWELVGKFDRDYRRRVHFLRKQIVQIE